MLIKVVGLNYFFVDFFCICFVSRVCFVFVCFIVENLMLSILLNKCSKEYIIYDYRNYIWVKVL